MSVGSGIRTAYFNFPSYNFQSPSAAAWLTIGSNGYVGVDTMAPSYPFYVNGQAGGTTAWTNASDARLKKDVTPITGALAVVEQLQGVRYRWRPVAEREVGKDLKLPLDEPQIGFIAQDVEKVVPEAVDAPKPGSNDVYSLKETKLIPVLVEAIKEEAATAKEQQAEIEALRSEIAALKAGR